MRRKKTTRTENQQSTPIEDLFALPSGKEMLPVLGAFSPVLSRQRSKEHCADAGVQKNPTSGDYEPRMHVTWELPGRPRTTVRVSAQGWRSDADGPLFADIARDVVSALGPEGLRIFYGLLIHLHDNYHNGTVVVDTDKLLDTLGYTRRRQGRGHYHHGANVRKVRRLLRLLTTLQLDATYDRSGQTQHLKLRLFTCWATREVYDATPEATGTAPFRIRGNSESRFGRKP